MTCLITAGLLVRDPRVCLCQYEYLIIITLIKIQAQTTKRVLGWQGGKPFCPWSWWGGYFGTLQSESGACVLSAHVCVVRSLQQGQGKAKREPLTFFPGGTRFWLVLRMCVRAFLIFFSFMLDSTAGGRNSERPHSFLRRVDHCNALAWWDHILTLTVQSPMLILAKWWYLQSKQCLIINGFYKVKKEGGWGSIHTFFSQRPRLTGCTWARPSGSAWWSWWGCTSAGQPVAVRR